MILARWEVWWAYVDYEDKPDAGKVRPVLIVNNKETYVFTLKMTSHEKREHDSYDYELKQWQHANLEKPTTVRVGCLYKLEHSSIKERIGRLHVVDIYEIQKLIDRRRSESSP